MEPLERRRNVRNLEDNRSHRNTKRRRTSFVDGVGRSRRHHQEEQRLASERRELEDRGRKDESKWRTEDSRKLSKRVISGSGNQWNNYQTNQKPPASPQDLQCGPCLNGGSCSNKGNGCSCPIGFVGQHCQQRVHLCGSNYCKNGGTCLQAGSATICLCSSGYSGMYCERTTFDTCSQRPCLNDAVCRDTATGFRCGCRGSTTGDRCELTGDVCSRNPCLNDGGCVDYCGGRTRLCFCRGDYGGDRCQEGPVSTAPPSLLAAAGALAGPAAGKALAGSAAGAAAGMALAAAAAAAGRDCGAASPCVNGGKCFIDGRGGVNCLCPEGFAGNRCEVARDACSRTPGPCRHGGSCIDDTGTGLYRCICRAGYFGTTCEKGNVTCGGTNPCLNQGVCSSVQANGSFVCKCQPGFTGPLCGEREARPCAGSPCLNNGTCVDVFVGASLSPSSSTHSPLPAFTCICPANFSGRNCEFPTTSLAKPCDSKPCYNGGTCLVVPTNDSFHCLCLPVYTGPTCNQSENPCFPNPCAPGKECFIRNQTYTCENIENATASGAAARVGAHGAAAAAHGGGGGDDEWLATLKSGLIVNSILIVFLIVAVILLSWMYYQRNNATEQTSSDMPNMEREIQYRKALAQEEDERNRQMEKKEREEREQREREREEQEREEAEEEEEIEEEEEKEREKEREKEAEKPGHLGFFGRLFGDSEDDKTKKKKPKPKPKPKPEPEPEPKPKPEPEAKPEKAEGVDEATGNENLNNPLGQRSVGLPPRRYSAERRRTSTDAALRAVLDRQQGDNRELMRTVIRRYYPNFKDD